MLRIAHVVLATGILLALSGCATGRYAYYGRGRYAEPDTLRQMTKQDVIALSAAKVNDDVIISQIRSSGSFFVLGTQDIIDLSNAGVSNKVIQEMIATGRVSQEGNGSGTYYYPYWYGDYYSPYWWYPWYPSLSLGFWYGHYAPFSRGYFPRYGVRGYFRGGAPSIGPRGAARR